MHVLMVASEVVPFAKTGGLADVCGSLPVALEEAGIDVTVILPAYRQALRSGQPIEPTGVSFEVPIGTKKVAGTFLKSTLPNSSVPVYLVQNDAYYDRDQLYVENGHDYKDNCERFVFFSRAAMEAIRLLPLEVDVIHAHDWQAALTSAYLKTDYRGKSGYDHIASIYTIHNLAYQGRFWHWDMLLTGLDWKLFNWRQMEFFGDLNLMKTGLTFSDALTTVSPRYAQEIQTPEQGCGLEGVLQYRHDDLTGIVNGVDYREWNSETDSYLPANYGVSDYAKGKAACKAALQQTMGLPQRADVPLLGFVGRLATQKGLDLIESLLGEWLPAHDAQWVFLGTGEPRYQQILERLVEQHPEKIAAKIGFSNAMAHAIEAGVDMFLMPSRYEPCGLNQLYSLKYGTVPIVRTTGGLADTITDATSEALADGTANGFRFDDYDAASFSAAVARACEMYHRDKAAWSKLIESGMNQDWSWGNSARQYMRLYDRVATPVRQPLTV